MQPDTTHQSYKSHINTYLYVWLTLLSILVLIKASNAPQHIVGYSFATYFCLSWISFMFVNYYEGNRLMQYLKKNHQETWKRITHVPMFGAGGTNSFRTLDFVYSKDNLGDTNIKWLKTNYQDVLTLMFLLFISYPITFILLMVL
jgi:hypothetical protein